jgi:hypothetical protein
LTTLRRCGSVFADRSPCVDTSFFAMRFLPRVTGGFASGIIDRLAK